MKILYLCTGNSARSQMAEAFTRAMAPAAAGIEVFSAGTHPKEVHPQTIAVMAESGVDVGGARSKGIDEVPFDAVDLVVTLCDDARATCPAPPPGARRIHWGLRDPALTEGSPDDVRESFRAVRDEVRTCVKRLLFELATTRGGRPGA
ncbi:MAG TPA: arsenate reductase ArsC [Candidatus Polarisedimenticolia bacterium]|nr:arsenate reductase ArsC [Candidatus Polarisedimenticolia bacterium]